jgi:hypothetical protein
MFGGGEGLEWWAHGRGRIGMVGPQVGMQNRETVAANCVLGIQIFLLHPNNLI